MTNAEVAQITAEAKALLARIKRTKTRVAHQNDLEAGRMTLAEYAALYPDFAMKLEAARADVARRFPSRTTSCPTARNG